MTRQEAGRSAVAVGSAMLSGITPQGSASAGKYKVMYLMLELLFWALEQKRWQHTQRSKHTHTTMSAPFQGSMGAFQRKHDSGVFDTVNGGGMEMLCFCPGKLMGSIF